MTKNALLSLLKATCGLTALESGFKGLSPFQVENNSQKYYCAKRVRKDKQVIVHYDISLRHQCLSLSPSDFIHLRYIGFFHRDKGNQGLGGVCILHIVI